MPAPANISALIPMQSAIVAALRADSFVQAILHADPLGGPAATPDAFARVYDEGTTPADLVGRWIEVGSPSEAWAKAFSRGGSSIGFTVHLWHTPVDGDDVGKGTILALWMYVATVLSTRLPLGSGHVQLFGTATLIDVAKDTDGQSWHGVVRYDTRTKVGP